MAETIHLAQIDRGPAYVAGRVVDPSTLAGRPTPNREWLVAGLIPRGKVVLFTGDGGLGKSLLMQQLCTAVATGWDWLGLEVQSGTSFALFCEDSNEELHRRQCDINRAMGLEFVDLYRMAWLSGEGLDCALMEFSSDRGGGKLTKLYLDLLERWKATKPALVVIDTLADTFAGNELVRFQVRSFINQCLASICQETGATVILCGHPSQSGMASGSGFSGSTAWNNSVRARLYLTRPDDRNPDPDERVLTTKKQNYGRSTGEMWLRWQDGAFDVVTDLATVPKGEIANAAEEAFLRALAWAMATGQNVNTAKNQTNYAPKAFTGKPETKGFKRDVLESTMNRLLSSGVVIVEESGPPSKVRRRLIIAGTALYERLKPRAKPQISA